MIVKQIGGQFVKIDKLSLKNRYKILIMTYKRIKKLDNDSLTPISLKWKKDLLKKVKLYFIISPKFIEKMKRYKNGKNKKSI